MDIEKIDDVITRRVFFPPLRFLHEYGMSGWWLITPLLLISLVFSSYHMTDPVQILVDVLLLLAMFVMSTMCDEKLNPNDVSNAVYTYSFRLGAVVILVTVALFVVTIVPLMTILALYVMSAVGIIKTEM